MEERRRSSDVEIDKLTARFDKMSSDMHRMENSMVRMEASFDSSKDMTKILLDAVIQNQSQQWKEQQNTNARHESNVVSITARTDSLEQSRDRLLGWFAGAGLGGGAVGAFLARTFFG